MSSRKKQREKLEQEYVNAHRNTWGTNKHISTKKLKAMSTRELKQSIRSLNDFARFNRRKK